MLRYSSNGKRKEITIGQYPFVGKCQIRCCN
ncbi:hypothetical protein [Pseudoalteromonas sp. B62]